MTQIQALRLIDANANRAAEGLRTLEDYARLAREDPIVAGWLKELRHQLADVLKPIDRAERLASRSAENDAGTQITTCSEATRHDLEDIVPAAVERITQALRGLEEYSKHVSRSLSDPIKQLRYQAYDLLAKAELRLLHRASVDSAQLYLLMDCSLPLEEFVPYVRALAAAGVDWFQLRDKRAEGRQLLQYALAAKQALSGSEASLWINDRVDIALACGAAGVHLGQTDLPLQDARRLVSPSMCIGISTHDFEQATEAEQGGADYIGCGPMFESTTKSFTEFAGPKFLQQAVATVRLPIFAIGGINSSNIATLVDVGCWRVAVSGVIHGAEHPIDAARQLKQSLQRARTRWASSTQNPIS